MLGSEYLIYTNENNESINIGYDYDLLPVSFDETVDNSLNTTKFTLQDGSTYVSSSLDDRQITIKCTYKINQSLALEKQVIKTIQPKQQGRLAKVNKDGIKYIDVRPVSVPTIERKTGRGEITIDLVAHYPYYYTQEIRERIAKKVPLLRFPVTYKEKRFAAIVRVVESEVVNIGDTSGGFTVVMNATAEVQNPSFINVLTGEKIKLNYTMQLGDVVEIINLPYDKEILLNGVKNFSILNRDESTFFEMNVGRNMFGVAADLNATMLTTYIKYNPRYLM